MIVTWNYSYIIGTIIAIFIAYIVGSLNWSLIIGKIFYKIDVRKYYSKNAGATNTNRKLGYKIAIVVLLLDALKVPITMLLIFSISLIKTKNINFGQISYYFPIIFVAIGHAFPIFFKFKGGKCASIVIGFSLFINPIFFLILFISFFTTLFLSKYVSLSSIIAAILLAILMWIPYLSGLEHFINSINELENNKLLFMNQLHKFTNPINGNFYYDDILLINSSMFSIIILMIILHKKNIINIINKNERKLVIQKNKKIKNTTK